MSGEDNGPGGPQGEASPFEPGMLGREKPVRAPDPASSPSGSGHSALPGGAPAGPQPGAIPDELSAGPRSPALPDLLPGSDSSVPRVPPDREPADGRYPMRYEVEYPERLSRLKTFFRGFLIIPAWFFLYLVMGVVYAGFPVGWTTVFVKKRYPRWLFAANAGALGFLSRSWAYAALQTDRYPSFDTDTSPVTLEYDEPEQHRISRWRVLFWKGVLLVPHFIVLSFLQLAAGVVVFLSWWAILFTGHYPRGLFGFVTGITRWHLRVVGYFGSFNDRYPPFALSAEAGPASRAVTVINGVIGGLIVGGFCTLIGVAIAVGNDPHTESVDYAKLQGTTSGGLTTHVAQGAVSVDASGGRIEFILSRVDDPGEQLVPLLVAEKGRRVVVFEWTVRNFSDVGAHVAGPADVRLTSVVEGKRTTSSAELLVVAGQVAPGSVRAGIDGKIQAVFIVPQGAQPVSLRFTPDFAPMGGIRYDFK